MSDIIVYNNGELELDISIDNETIWLTQKKISELFEVTIPNVSMHIKAIYKAKELDKIPTIKKYLIVQKEGNREVSRDVDHYNLDVIISVGYRVNSLTATKFRQWATSVLKQYITNGYTINSEKITNDRFVSLESKVQLLSSKLNILEQKELKPSQGIFYNGEVFDAYNFVADLIRDAKESIVLIDNYVDDTTLTLFSKNQNIEVIVYTQTISKQLKLDLEKYNSQYKNISIKTFKDSHDRFMIIDKKEVFHIGASLKDLGKKWFAFSRFDVGCFGLLERLG